MSPHTGEAIRVLTVDDDPALLDTISLYLENIGGFEVSSTGSPGDALNRLETEYFDICISDYDMPEMNGVQLLGRIRREGNPVPYILITGSFSDGLERRARGAGASDVLQKSGVSVNSTPISSPPSGGRSRGSGAVGFPEWPSAVQV